MPVKSAKCCCRSPKIDLLDIIMTTTIQAQVSQATLSKVGRLFNASLTDCLNELLQNARRAGATTVTIRLSDDRLLTVEDDGTGIAQPQTLLTLGESDWSEATKLQEAPAGMGVFSLANRSVTIRSHDWQVHLTPAHFAGEAVATVESCEMISGTRLSFILKETEVPHLHQRVCQIAKYYPLPVLFNGEAILRKNFLESAAYVEEWQGLRIGVRRKYTWEGTDSINFYGLTLTQSLPTLCCNGDTLSVRVDVIDCPQLKLVLPARKEVVQDTFWTTLGTAIRRVLYRYISTLPHHDLAYDQWQQARLLGVELQAAQAALPEFVPAIANFCDCESGQVLPISDRSLIIDIAHQICGEQQIFWRAFQQAQMPYGAIVPRSSYAGYAWYDGLPRLSELRFEIEQEGEAIGVEQWWEQQFPTGTEIPASRRLSINFNVQQVWAIALITDASKKTQEVRLACEVLFLEDYDNHWYEVEEIPIVLNHSAQLNVEELATLLENSYFSPSTDSDSDSVYTQRENFCEAAYERAAKALLTEEAALQERMKMAAERHLRWIVPLNQKLEIRFVPRGIDDPVISVQLMEAD
jgi:hypothetical protein